MAHIAEYMINAASSVGLNNSIARELGVSSSPQQVVCASFCDQAGSCSYCTQHSEIPAPEEKEKYIWRMQQRSETPRQYSIFPSQEKLSISPNRQNLKSESESTLISGERHNTHKPKEPNKRRKPSITDLGPMTTVHEAAMDSRKWLKDLRIHNIAHIE